MKIKMKRVINGQQGYWSIVELEHTEEEFVNHPQFGRVRIVNCTETETHCGFGAGCFAVTRTTLPQSPMFVRALELKRAGWEIV